MKGRFSRLVTALALTSSLLASTITAFARTQQPSTNSNPDAGTSYHWQAKTDQDPAKKAEERTPVPPVPSKAANARPLSVNEDPNMIGKRNINKGIVAKMSGSTEKRSNWASSWPPKRIARQSSLTTR